MKAGCFLLSAKPMGAGRFCGGIVIAPVFQPFDDAAQLRSWTSSARAAFVVIENEDGKTRPIMKEPYWVGPRVKYNPARGGDEKAAT